jgi:hypothetical protein
VDKEKREKCCASGEIVVVVDGDLGGEWWKVKVKRGRLTL